MHEAIRTNCRQWQSIMAVQFARNPRSLRRQHACKRRSIAEVPLWASCDDNIPGWLVHQNHDARTPMPTYYHHCCLLTYCIRRNSKVSTCLHPGSTCTAQGVIAHTRCIATWPTNTISQLSHRDLAGLAWIDHPYSRKGLGILSHPLDPVKIRHEQAMRIQNYSLAVLYLVDLHIERKWMIDAPSLAGLDIDTNRSIPK